jgi:hypothetical protein
MVVVVGWRGRVQACHPPDVSDISPQVANRELPPRTVFFVLIMLIRVLTMEIEGDK